MRKTIFILTALLAAGSCIRENTDGCPARLSLVFELDDPYSTGDFDSDIGNDVELQLFRNELFSGSIIIPYDQIRGGRPYSFRKNCSDRLAVVAYALPPGQIATVPSPAAGESYYGQFVRMEPSAGLSRYAPYGGSLYLGTATVGGGASVRNRYTVAMAPCFAKVTVLVVNAESTRTAFSAASEIGIEGTAAAMRVHDKSASGAIEVRAALSDGDGFQTTGPMRILPPQTPGEPMKVNLYSDGRLLLYVETGLEAVAGKEFVVKIVPGNLTAEITVDGWTRKTQVVTP